MTFQPDIHRRGSIRLPGYDYSRDGAYFITVCTHDRELWFGDIRDGEAHPCEAGRIVERVWRSLPDRFTTIKLDSFVVMPNHIHGVLMFVGAQFIAPGPRSDSKRTPHLGEVVRTLKAASTSLIRAGGDTGFAWQRNYYEHVIRNEAELRRIRAYVTANPLRWHEDPENPTVYKARRPDVTPERPWAR